MADADVGRRSEPARGSAGWWDERYAEADMLWSLTPNRFVAEEAAGLAPGAVLDLACGEGRNALWLAERGWTATGVDFSRTALDRARSASQARALPVTWVEADVLAWRPERAYDLVLLAYLQVPAAERQRALTIAADATAPGGSLLVIGHDVRNLAEGTGGPQDPGLLWTPTEVSVRHFDAVRAETAERPVDGAVALDTVVRLVRRTH